ncbi:hypothetical protein QML28_30360, partial [Klebsiella pneumoniae]|uniref:hypothetical protein n=1 Tax=Klebsiella pneumoniae TaxID=573 RepID=UPI003A800123
TADGAVITTNGTTTTAIDDVADMPAGSSIVYTVAYTVDADYTGATVVNTATVNDPEGTTDPTPGDNSSTDTDSTDPTADLTITKDNGVTTVVPGQSYTYTITVTNAG